MVYDFEPAHFSIALHWLRQPSPVNNYNRVAQLTQLVVYCIPGFVQTSMLDAIQQAERKHSLRR